MTQHLDVTMRNAILAAYETSGGTGPLLRYYSGSAPANESASPTGTLLVEITLPSDWMSAPSGGQSTKAGTWSDTAIADGVIGYYRFYISDGSRCFDQGTVSEAVAFTTSATTSANSNILTFASTTGISVGVGVSGVGVPSGATVLDTTSTTVTISAPSTAGVGSGVTILFGDTSGDAKLSETTMVAGLTVVTVDARTLIAPGG